MQIFFIIFTRYSQIECGDTPRDSADTYLFVELVEWDMRYHPELVRRLPPTLSLQYMEEYTFHEEHIRELA